MNNTLKIFRNAFCFLSLILLSGLSYASHMIGGDITYRCLENNRFEITLTLFQDCLSGQPTAIAQDDPAFYSIYTGGPNPTPYESGSVPSSSTTIVDPNFSNECINNYPQTCLRKQVFTFVTMLAPSSTGYYIVYQRCCRNATINNLINPGNIGVTYSAEIPPFVNGVCPNNSAKFGSLPPQIICVNNPFSYDFSATDPDNDSLSYELCSAYIGGSTQNPLPAGMQITPPPFTPVSYMPPYNATVPVSGVPPIQINPVTGLMTGTPNISGRFVVTVCVHEWREGQIINTLSRDVQFVITNCSKAVVANIPELAEEPNTYIIQCDGYTVHFINNSSGGINYHWEFGVPGATSNAFEPTFTYPDTGTYKVKLVVNPNSTCVDSITRLVKIYPEFHAGFTWSGKLCPGEPIQFTDTTFASFPPIVSWQWNFGDGDSAISSLQNPVHVFPQPGGTKQVTLISKSGIGCVDTATTSLPLPYFDPFAGNDTIIVKGYPFHLTGTGSQYYFWSPPDYLSDRNIANPTTQFPDTGYYTYILRGSTDEGCIDEDTINIRVVTNGTIFIPTAFTPNGDGINDFLEPRIVGYTSINSFRIFNRWGQMVFNSINDNYPKWDGTFQQAACEMGSYFWEINVTDILGNEVVKKGDITLVR